MTAEQDIRSGAGAAARTVGTAPTLDDVARVAGVSRATVSRVVTGKRRVAPEIQAVVLEAITAVGYVPNAAARSLATRRTGAIIVVVSGTSDTSDSPGGVDFTDPFFGRVVGGMLRALAPRDLSPMVTLAETAADRIRIVSMLRNGSAEGALLVSTRGEDALPAMLHEAGLSAVLFARPASHLPMSYVDVAHRDGARLAANHLVERGRQHVVAIGGPLDVPAAHDRLAGFQDEMARHGQAWTPYATGNFTYASGVEAMRDLLNRESQIDGLFASNDLMALGAIEALRERGLRIPDDVSVVGFDDTTLGALATPGLTTVRQPIEEMTAEMARMLFEMLESPTRRPVSRIFAPTLVVRGSS